MLDHLLLLLHLRTHSVEHLNPSICRGSRSYDSEKRTQVSMSEFVLESRVMNLYISKNWRSFLIYLSGPSAESRVDHIDSLLTRVRHMNDAAGGIDIPTLYMHTESSLSENGTKSTWAPSPLSPYLKSPPLRSSSPFPALSVAC